MMSNAKNLRLEIQKLEQELTDKKSELASIEEKCIHVWDKKMIGCRTEPAYKAQVHRNGIPFSPEINFREQTIPAYELTCKNCGKKELTEEH